MPHIPLLLLNKLLSHFYLVFVVWQSHLVSASYLHQQQNVVISNPEFTRALNQATIQHVLGDNQTAATVTASGINTQNGNQFLIKWIHNNPQNQEAYVIIQPVNHTNLHEPRIELRYQSKHPYVDLSEGAPNNTVVAAVVVYDDDSGPNGETTLTIDHGNELGHFKLVSTKFTNTIQVNGAPLSSSKVPEYNLTIVARDKGSPPRSSTSNLIIRLHASPSSLSNTQLDPPVKDLMYFGAMLVVTFSIVVLLIILICALQRPKNRSPPPKATLSHTADHSSPYCFGLTNF